MYYNNHNQVLQYITSIYTCIWKIRVCMCVFDFKTRISLGWILPCWNSKLLRLMTFFGAYKSAWGAVFGENLWEIIFHNIKRRFLAISFWAPQRPRYRLSNRGMPGTVESEWGDQGSFTCDVFVVLMVAFRSIPSLKFQNTTHTTPPKRAKNHLNSNFSMPPPPPTPRKKCLFPFSSAWLVETPGHGFLQQGRQTRFYLSSAINLGWMPPENLGSFFRLWVRWKLPSKLKKIEPWSKWSDTLMFNNKLFVWMFSVWTFFSLTSVWQNSSRFNNKWVWQKKNVPNWKHPNNQLRENSPNSQVENPSTLGRLLLYGAHTSTIAESMSSTLAIRKAQK